MAEEIPELHPELAEIINQCVHSVQNDEPYYQATTNFRGEMIRQTNYRLKVRCRIVSDFLSPQQERALQTFEAWMRSGRKFNCGRFKGLVPISFDYAYNPERFNREMLATFVCDSFDAPETVGDLMEWEMLQLNSTVPDTRAYAPAHVSAPAKPKKEEHFDKELFDME
jgi:hypothetical protein